MNRALSISDLGIAFPGGMSSEELLKTVKQAEADGFRSCWVSEDYYFGGAMATAGAIAAVTEQIGIGIGVVNPYTRNPEVIAMESAVVDSLSKGRFTLAMGASNRRWIETQMCIPYEKPRTHMVEAIGMIRSLLAGETVNFDGQTVSAHNVKLDFAPYRPDLPLYMGVSGEQSLRQAGATADGVLLSIMSSAEYAAWARRMVDEGAKEAGRKSHVPISVYVPLYLGDQAEAAKAMAHTIAYFVGVGANRVFIKESGISAEELRPLAERAASGEDAADLVTASIADRYTICGDKAHCLQRLQKYFDAGVDQVILCSCDEVSALQMMEFAKKLFE